MLVPTAASNEPTPFTGDVVEPPLAETPGSLRLLRPLGTIASADEDAPRFLVEGVVTLPVGEVSILYGDSGIGKSFMAYQLGVCVAAGQEFLGGKPVTGPVVILDFENPVAETAFRLRVTADAIGVPQDVVASSVHVSAFHQTGQTLHAVADDVVAELELLNPVLIVVDGWQGAFGGDSTKGEQVDAAYRVLRRLSAGIRSVLVLHHISSTQAGNAQPTVGGNRYIQHFARCVYLMRSVGENAVSLMATKENYGISHERQPLNKNDHGRGLFFSIPETTVSENTRFRCPLPPDGPGPRKARPKPVSLYTYVMDFLKANGGSCRESKLIQHAAEELDVTSRTMSQHLKPVIMAAVEEGRLSRMDDRYNTYRLSIPEKSEALPTTSN